MAQTIQESNYQYFLKANIGKYIGQWIAICEDKIISNGKDLKEVVAKAKAASRGKKFLLAKVPSEETMIF
jgi:hypothetical protein